MALTFALQVPFLDGKQGGSVLRLLSGFERPLDSAQNCPVALVAFCVTDEVNLYQIEGRGERKYLDGIITWMVE